MARQLGRIAQGQVASPIRPGSGHQGRGIIQKRLGPGDHLRAALHIIAALGCLAGDRIGAIERVIQAAPARIGGIEQEARVEHRHDQLRPGGLRQFRVNIGRIDRKGGGLLDQIADRAQKGGGLCPPFGSWAAFLPSP
jgi:hypothetical protein